jgi:predicted ester cyclase
MTKARTTVKSKSKSKAKTAGKAGAKKAKVPAKKLPATKVSVAAVEPVDNKELYRRFCEDVLNGNNVERATQFLDPVVVSHSPLPEQQPGADGFIASLGAMRAAFPDLNAVATHLVAEGEFVAARLQVSATHSGDFFGIRATGRRIHYEEQVFVRFAGGRIVEHWSVADGLSILQQLDGDARR